MTPAQRTALTDWFDERGLLARRLDGRTLKSVQALGRDGLAVYAPVEGHTYSCWQLTDAGRAARTSLAT